MGDHDSGAETHRTRSTSVAVLSAVAMVTVAVVDFWTPLGVALSVGHAIPLLIARQGGSTRLVWGLALTATALTLAGYVASAGGDGVAWMVAANRGLSLLVIWSVAILSVRSLELEQGTRARGVAYAAVIRATADGLVTVGAKGAIISLNPAAEKMFGLASATMLGEQLCKLIVSKPGAGSTVFEQVRATDSPLALTGTRGGVTFPLEVSMGAITDEHSEPIYVASFRDISARRELETATARLAEVVSTSADCIITKNLDGIIQTWNASAAERYGYSKEEAIGKHVNLIVPEDRQGEIVSILDRIRSGERVTAFETVRVTKSGGLAEVSLAVSPLIEDGHVVGASAIGRDVTALAQVRRELERRGAVLESANEELESFSYSVAHDLRAPLRAIDGFSKILVHDYEETLDVDGRRLLGIIVKNVSKMSQLIDDLLEFSKLGRRSLTSAPIDMARLLEEVVDEKVTAAKALDAARQIEVTVDTLPSAEGDEELVRQVWRNLVENALKYSSWRNPAKIHVSGKTSREGVEYCVRDNGAGFDMEYLDKLFGVFQRLHKPTEFEGTGVGLALVKRIVVRHGGRVWAEGAVDQGATFWFALPVRKRARTDVGAMVNTPGGQNEGRS